MTMTKRTDLDILLRSEEVVFCDGAVGTLLVKAGFGADPPVVAANVEAPDLVRALHRAYLAAGAQILQANTFGGNRLHLERVGWEARVADVNHAGVRLAREAADGRALVAGTMGPIGDVAPLGRVSQEDAAAVFREHAIFLAEAGVDLIVIETMQDLREARLAVRAAREATGLPVACSITYGSHQAIFTQIMPPIAAQELLAAGATLVGVNCGPGPTTAAAVLADIHEVLPEARLLAQPSAGVPDRRSGRPGYFVTPERFAAWGLRVAQLGVKVLGGCCGTTPDHLRALVEAVRHRAGPE
ncbi:MAG: homocysteine S-methyltransferase family protein [Chloroflexi bacterium]|nr:homocysteine S-methyltransferase family protein [Chloroflexota bacterium]